MRRMILTNASDLLDDSLVAALVKPLQIQIDRDFVPHWPDVERVTVEFARVKDIPHIPKNAWPIFFNKHSDDAGALGWHDDRDGRQFSRVFIGDCIRFGLNWHTTVSHEALEILLDPDIERVWRMPDGRLAAYEACDAVESDAQAYTILHHKMSNFVLPAYFNASHNGPYDFRHQLHAPCPALTPGGYMSLTDVHGVWSQVTMEHADGSQGRRAAMAGRRRQARSRLPVDALQIV